jgi:hypothetical protein
MKTRVLLAMLAVVIIAGHQRPATTAAEPSDAELLSRLDRMERQAAILSQSMDEVTTRYFRDVYPIESALLATGRVREAVMARRVAWALVRETERRHLSPRLIAEVVKKENPWLKRDTTSFAGAVGITQVMPFHALGGPHRDACGGADLTDVDVNVCYGTDIFREKIGIALDRALRDALNWYSGCVRTPGCEQYAVGIMAALVES